MTKEELLEKAKRDYPVGTEAKSAYKGSTKFTIMPHWVFSTDSKGEISTGGFYVYYEGKWAEIISKPTDSLIEEAKRRYPIGTQIISAANKSAIFNITSDIFCVSVDGNVTTSGFHVRHKGVWAEIVQKAKPKPMPKISKEVYVVGQIFTLGKYQCKIYKGDIGTYWLANQGGMNGELLKQFGITNETLNSIFPAKTPWLGSHNGDSFPEYDSLEKMLEITSYLKRLETTSKSAMNIEATEGVKMGPGLWEQISDKPANYKPFGWVDIIDSTDNKKDFVRVHKQDKKIHKLTIKI